MGGAPAAGEVDQKVLASGRSACYKARDAFFQCVDKSKAATTEAANAGLLYPSECKYVRSQFEKMCRKTWVRHFDNQYCTQKRLKRLLEREEPTPTGPMRIPQKA